MTLKLDPEDRAFFQGLEVNRRAITVVSADSVIRLGARTSSRHAKQVS
ncbi:MAG: hypothetical protein K8F91_08735 [Candidatus Obscuribacterales bacterium]|nr:hypothetical protein [Candidatus Obscuribacterales bacterium]